MNEDLITETKPPEMPSVAPPQMPSVSLPQVISPAQMVPYGVSQEDRTNGMLVHLLALLTGWIIALITALILRNYFSLFRCYPV